MQETSLCSKGECEILNNWNSDCLLFYASWQFNYIGGYYGACNEERMMLDLIQNGPFGVAILANINFDTYTGGVFSGCDDPYQQLNHAIVVVGYGVDKQSGRKYWICRNSWGENFGVNGHIYIERGVDMCGIESIALSVKPIPVI